MRARGRCCGATWSASSRSEEHTSELQSRLHLVCRLLLEKKKTTVAVLTGGLMQWYIQTGPVLFGEKSVFQWGLLASWFLGIIAVVILLSATLQFFAALVR